MHKRASSSLSPKEQARRYLARVPGAIEGAGGDIQTIQAAYIAVNDFALSVADSLDVLAEWNQRCTPPWSPQALQAKVQSALKTAKGVRGCKLRENLPRRNRSAPRPKPVFVPPAPKPPIEPLEKPNRDGFKRATLEQFRALTASRPYYREGLDLASLRGLLVFGEWHEQACYGVTDQSGNVLEIRRIDGKPFPAIGSLQERKSHAVKGSQKSWPVGVLESVRYPIVILTEGVPDFLAAHAQVDYELRERTIAVVGMLGAGVAIADAALVHFRGKVVRLFPHVDGAGLKGAAKWQAQLKQAGAARVDIFDFGAYRKPDGVRVNDFYEAIHTEGVDLPRSMFA